MPSSELSGVFCYTYVLRSGVNNSFYVGFTKDFRSRIAEHNKGLVFSTKPSRPWHLLYYEAHTSEADARRRENYLKTTAGGRALNKMLREKLTDMRKQASRKSTTRYA